MTRTDAILRAITERLNERRLEIDRADGIRSIRLDLRFSPDCLEPRELVDLIERERRKAPRGQLRKEAS